MRLPSKQFRDECQELLDRFNAAETIDDSEELLLEIPTYLWAIVTLYDALEATKKL